MHSRDAPHEVRILVWTSKTVEFGDPLWKPRCCVWYLESISLIYQVQNFMRVRPTFYCNFNWTSLILDDEIDPHIN